MYRQISVPVDNSEYANAAVDLAVAFGKAFGANLVGSHVVAAGLHAHRFRQMESVLPEKYHDEAALEERRRSHASLISRGLRIIAESYLDAMASKAHQAGLPFARKVLDGKNSAELVRDIRESNYDLVIMGALGLGAVKASLVGSVCERVVRRVRADILVVRNALPLEESRGAIVVGVDGSAQAFAGLQAALAIGRALGRPVEAVAVYDPFLHAAIFHRLVDVLSGSASKLFHLQEQERLHEAVIDAGLTKIYRSHLERARELAEGEGVPLQATLLTGKAFDRILQHVRNTQPWLLVLGRVGFHGDEELDIGSTSENLVRLAPCHVLLTSRKFCPPMDVKVETAAACTP